MAKTPVACIMAVVWPMYAANVDIITEKPFTSK